MDVLRSASLLKIQESALTPFQKEHVIPVFFDGSYKVSIVRDFAFLPPLSYSVDTKGDWQKVSSWVEQWRLDGVFEKTLGWEWKK